MQEYLLDHYLPIIQRQYPDITEKDIMVLSGGYAHTVIVAKNHAFRFPKTKEFEMMQHVENEFSKHFVSQSPIPMPLMLGHTDEATGKTYQTYEFIQGVPFTQKIAMTLTDEQLIIIATEIGQFLTKLHLYPRSQLERLSDNFVKNAQEYARYFENIIEEDKKMIGSLLTDTEWKWVEKNSNDYYELVKKHPFTLKVIHEDMLPKHILIDERTHRLAGIIDFTLKLGDPARDLCYVDRYGELFLKTVYKNYPPIDEHFDERRKFHARDLCVAHLYIAIQRKDKILRRQYLNEIKEYIATHPL